MDDPKKQEKIYKYFYHCQYFYRYKISPFYWTKIFKLKAIIYGVEIDGHINISGPVDVMRVPGSRILLGDGVSIISSSRRCSSGSIYAPAKLRTHSKTSEIILGKNVGLNGTSIVARSKRIEIGDGTIVAPNVTIVDSDYHALWPPENRLTNPAYEKDKDVIIGKNVWIGTQCLILRGAKIGDNSIISAGSIVQKRIPKNVVAWGQPAEVMFTFSDRMEEKASISS